MNLGITKNDHKLPYNAVLNMVLVGLKLFQDVTIGSISDKTTRVNSSFLRTTETGCRITTSSAHILEMVLNTGKKRGILAVQYQRQSEVTENRSNETCICIVCYNF